MAPYPGYYKCRANLTPYPNTNLTDKNEKKVLTPKHAPTKMLFLFSKNCLYKYSFVARDLGE